MDHRVLRERAVAATGLSFTLSDPNLPDHPLIWVNEAFTATTGYPFDEAVGRNCRFLQGPDTDPVTVEAIRTAVAERRSTTVTLRNYRRDGTPFWNEIAINPVWGDDGRLDAFVGVQTDVTVRVELAQLKQAAEAAEAMARDRLIVLAETTSRLASTLDLDELLDRLGSAVVPALADWVVVALTDGDGGIAQAAVRHRDPDRKDLAAELERALPDTLSAESRTLRVMRDGSPILVSDAGDWSALVGSDRAAEVVDQLGVSSAIYVPLFGRTELVGSMGLVSASPDRRYGPVDLEVATDLGRRCGLIIEGARLYEREHRTAESLQRSLLPNLPVVKGFDLAARYLPADHHAQVGGDFYEVLPLPDGSIGIAVGDVVGHDLAAASSMGHLRGLLRTVAWTNVEDGRTDPADVLLRVDRLIQQLDIGPLATLFYGRLHPSDREDDWGLTYATAGHPAPLLRRPDGSVSLLDAASGLLLGAGEDLRRTVATVDIPAGAVLVGFTDGLVERRDQDLDAGYERVISRLTTRHRTIETLVDDLITAAGDNRYDDTVVLAISPIAGGRPTDG